MRLRGAVGVHAAPLLLPSRLKVRPRNGRDYQRGEPLPGGGEDASRPGGGSAARRWQSIRGSGGKVDEDENDDGQADLARHGVPSPLGGPFHRRPPWPPSFHLAKRVALLS